MSNKIYTNPEPLFRFNAAAPGGTGSLFDVTSLPNNSGQVSDVHSLPTGARSQLYRWNGRTALNANAPAGSTVEIYVAETDEDGYRDGNLPSSNTLLGDAEKRRSLKYIGSFQVDKNNYAAGDPIVAKGLFESRSPKLSVVWWNLSGVALNAASGLHEISIAPVPDEVES